ncbi:glycosidase [Terrilactibacillus sp. BCM23-1]|uniref:Glycosidase n=1 Tax=Terrilactibacillus tamarindi TaxID=2599694 RepID=A0A6N8CNG4_9BACI|nr:GH25 family lysozyme [Terrilactibacillus tamarindi]MTT31501.1 glycosidase [Terrilactibacillus tamarindi]
MHFRKLMIVVGLILIFPIFNGSLPLQNKAHAATKLLAHGTSSLTVRSTPNGKYVGKLAKNEPFYIYGNKGSWYKIKFNKKDAYIYNTHVSKSKPPLWYKGYAGTKMNLYDISTGKLIGTFPKNEPLNVYAKQGNWLSIAYKTGYAHVSYKSVKKGTPKVWYTGYAADKLYARDSFNDKVIGTQTLASKVKVYAQQGNWLTIGYKGKYAHTYHTHVSRYVKRGIDIGQTQHRLNSPINFKKVKDAGFCFVVVKATGGLKDYNFYLPTDVQLANNVGLKTSVYHMFNATSKGKAIAEANSFAEKTKSVRFTGYVFIDVEYENLLKQTNKENLTAYVNAFYTRLAQLGYNKIGLYTSKSIYENKLNAAKLNKGMLLWLARYKNDTLGRSANMWQYTNTGRVPGIYGDVDLNVAYTSKIGG